MDLKYAGLVTRLFYFEVSFGRYWDQIKMLQMPENRSLSGQAAVEVPTQARLRGLPVQRICRQINRQASWGLRGCHWVRSDQVPGQAEGGLLGAGQLHLDGCPNLTAKVVEDMMEDYVIHRMIHSVSNPHTNARAESGVKRILMDIVSEPWCQELCFS